ncbi:hypothetical protein A9Q81_23645 [Gammaproteobacteria bacterium 42_54_T18]|nr:hypothetical protein A9Q81_23645 [Gammaproteobacteria bacterium 42_54_T18]
MSFSPKDSTWLNLPYDQHDHESTLFWWANACYMIPEVVNGTFSVSSDYGLFEAGEFFPELKRFVPIWRLGLVDDTVRLPPLRALGEGLAMQTTNTYAHHKPSGMLSVAQDKLAGSPSSQHVMWSAVLDEGITVYTTHPLTNSDYSFGYFTGGSSAPRIAQHNDVALILYNPKLPWLSLLSKNASMTHAFFPRDRFDEVEKKGNWYFGRKTDGYIALYSNNNTSFNETGDYAGREIIAKGNKNLWIAEIGEKEEDGSFEDFMQRVLQQNVIYDEQNNHLVIYETDFGPMEFSWENELTVNGTPMSLENYPRYDNPFVQQPWGDTDILITVNGTESTIEFELEE